MNGNQRHGGEVYYISTSRGGGSIGGDENTPAGDYSVNARMKHCVDIVLSTSPSEGIIPTSLRPNSANSFHSSTSPADPT
jgi:hypothetical protein